MYTNIVVVVLVFSQTVIVHKWRLVLDFDTALRHMMDNIHAKFLMQNSREIENAKIKIEIYIQQPQQQQNSGVIVVESQQIHL